MEEPNTVRNIDLVLEPQIRKSNTHVQDTQLVVRDEDRPNSDRNPSPNYSPRATSSGSPRSPRQGSDEYVFAPDGYLSPAQQNLRRKSSKKKKKLQTKKLAKELNQLKQVLAESGIVIPRTRSPRSPNRTRRQNTFETEQQFQQQ